MPTLAACSAAYRLHYIGVMRIAVTIAATLLAASVASAAVRHGHPYRRHWKHATFGKRALAGVTLGAAVSHPRHNAGGFVGRLGSGCAAHSVKTTVEHAGAAPLHEDLHYHRSTMRGF